MWLNIIQFIISIVLIGLILIQERSSGIGGLFGAENFAPYQTRRGLEKIIFFLTIAIAVLFASTALINIFIQ